MGDGSSTENPVPNNDLSSTSAYAIDAPVRISGSFVRLQSPFLPDKPLRIIKLNRADFSEDRGSIASAMTNVVANAEDKTLRVQTAAVLRKENLNAAPVFDSTRRDKLRQQLAAEYQIEDVAREDAGVTMHDLRLTAANGFTHDIRMGFETPDMYETWLRNKEALANGPDDDPDMPPRTPRPQEAGPLAIGVFSQPQELTLPAERYRTYIQSHAAVLRDVFRAVG